MLRTYFQETTFSENSYITNRKKGCCLFFNLAYVSVNTFLESGVFMAEKTEKKNKSARCPQSRTQVYQKTKDFFQKLTKLYYSNHSISGQEQIEAFGLLENCLKYAVNEKEKTYISRLLKEIQTVTPELFGYVAGKVCDELDLFLDPVIVDEKKEWFSHVNHNQVVMEDEKVVYVKVPRMYVQHIREACKEGKISSVESESALFKYLSLYTMASTSFGCEYMNGLKFVHDTNSLVITAFPSKESRNNLAELLLPDKKYIKINRKEKLVIINEILQKMRNKGLISYISHEGVFEAGRDNPIFEIHLKKGFRETNTRGFRRYSGYVLLDKGILRELETYRLGEGLGMSEADMLLSMWVQTCAVDPQVAGSFLVPVVCFPTPENRQTYNMGKVVDPRVKLEEIAKYWHVSRSTVMRKFSKFEKLGFIHHYYYVSTDKRNTKGHIIMLSQFVEYTFIDWYNEDARNYKYLSVNKYPVVSPLTLSLAIDVQLEKILLPMEVPAYLWNRAETMVYEGSETNLMHVKFVNPKMMEEYESFGNSFCANKYEIDVEEIKEKIICTESENGWEPIKDENDCNDSGDKLGSKPECVSEVSENKKDEPGKSENILDNKMGKNKSGAGGAADTCTTADPDEELDVFVRDLEKLEQVLAAGLAFIREKKEKSEKEGGTSARTVGESSAGVNLAKSEEIDGKASDIPKPSEKAEFGENMNHKHRERCDGRPPEKEIPDNSETLTHSSNCSSNITQNNAQSVNARPDTPEFTKIMEVLRDFCKTHQKYFPDNTESTDRSSA